MGLWKVDDKGGQLEDTISMVVERGVAERGNEEGGVEIADIVIGTEASEIYTILLVGSVRWV